MQWLPGHTILKIVTSLLLTIGCMINGKLFSDACKSFDSLPDLMKQTTDDSVFIKVSYH